MRKHKKNDMARFLYLNIYPFLIVCAGILTLAMPFYLINRWTLVIQVIVSIKLFLISGKLFSTWESKKKEIDILIKRNQVEFRPDTFETFMQAPCGRLIVHQVLRDLNRSDEYKSLLKLQKPLLDRIRENCTPIKTVVYINEEAL
jgi:hypothetical protein